MRNSTTKRKFATPVLSSIPGIKKLFGSSQELEVKTELVILLRPIVVDSDDDWPRIIQPAADRVNTLSASGISDGTGKTVSSSSESKAN
jgi:MSHA biogenesis protein MshL